MTCCFTGHREISASIRENLIRSLDEIITLLISQGTDKFICGGALGFDTLAAQAVIKAKKNNSVTLSLALPCKDQSARWSKLNKAVYEDILDNADEVNFLFEKYVTGCMHARDKYMVDSSDTVVAFYRGNTGGTQFTVKYAESSGKKVILI